MNKPIFLYFLSFTNKSNLIKYDKEITNVSKVDIIHTSIKIFVCWFNFFLLMPFVVWTILLHSISLNTCNQSVYFFFFLWIWIYFEVIASSFKKMFSINFRLLGKHLTIQQSNIYINILETWIWKIRLTTSNFWWQKCHNCLFKFC